jgi:MFS family permease
MNVLVAFPAFICMGYSQSYFGGVVAYESVYTLFPQLNTTTTIGEVKSHNALIQGVIVATVNLGAVAGCLSCMYIGNKLGRKKTTMLGALVALIGTIIHCSAFSTAQLVIGRGGLLGVWAMTEH